jgi:hypothetical protein
MTEEESMGKPIHTLQLVVAALAVLLLTLTGPTAPPRSSCARKFGSSAEFVG